MTLTLSFITVCDSENSIVFNVVSEFFLFVFPLWQ